MNVKLLVRGEFDPTAWACEAIDRTVLSHMLGLLNEFRMSIKQGDLAG